MIDALHFEFMQNALAAGLLASLLCGIMGALVSANRIVFLSGGIAHAAYGGIGLSFYFGWPFLAGTLGFSLAISLVMAAIMVKVKHQADAVIGVVWAVGMALGIILLDLTPGYNVDLMSYLFGSILSAVESDIWIMLAMCGLLTILTTVYYKELLAMSFDEEFARIRGVPVGVLYFGLIAMLSVAIVLVIQVVGLILVIALLTIPPFIVEKYAKSLFQVMAGSSLLGAVFTVSGLWLSYTFDLTSGASIIMVAGVVFFISLLLEQAASLLHRKQKLTSDK